LDDEHRDFEKRVVQPFKYFLLFGRLKNIVIEFGNDDGLAGLHVGLQILNDSSFNG
jgi:hypothetical protein